MITSGSVPSGKTSVAGSGHRRDKVQAGRGTSKGPLFCVSVLARERCQVRGLVGMSQCDVG